MDISGVCGYSGQPLSFISPDFFAFAAGNSLCIFDINKGAKDLLWKSEKGISAWSTHQHSCRIALAPRADGDSLSLFYYPNHTAITTLPNPSKGKIVYLTFSHDGTYLAGLSDYTDHKFILWNAQTLALLCAVDLPSQCHTCALNPLNAMLCTVYGSNSLYIGHTTEVLGEYTCQFDTVPLQEGVEGESVVSTVRWTPNNCLLVGRTAGEVDILDTSTKTLTPLFSLPLSPGEPSAAPVAIILSALHIIVGCSSGVIHWYNYNKSIYTSKDKKTDNDFSIPVQTMTLLNGETKVRRLTSLCFDKTFTSLAAGSSCGAIFRSSIDIEEKLRTENEDDANADDGHGRNYEEKMTLEVSVTPYVQMHEGVALCTKSLIIPVVDETDGGAPIDEIALIMTGSYAGEISFWKYSPVSAPIAIENTSAAGGMGINRPPPQIPTRLGRIILGDNEVESRRKAITSIETLSVAFNDGGRMIAIGTLDGWMEIWRLDAFLRETEEDFDPSSEEGNKVQLEPTLIFRKRFYSKAVSLLTCHESKPCLAIGSFHDHNVHMLVLSGDGQFDDISLLSLGATSSQPISLFWSGSLLWVASHEGYFFTFYPPQLHSSGNDSFEEISSDSVPPKVMWETHIPSLGSGAQLATGGVVLSCPSSPIIYAYDTLPTMMDLEDNKLLGGSGEYGDNEEIPMLTLPGTQVLSTEHSSPVLCVAQSQSGFVASGTVDGCIYLWRVRKAELVMINRLQLHSSAVITLCFTSDYSHIISCGADGSMFVSAVDKPAALPNTMLFYVPSFEPSGIEHDETLWIEQKKKEESDILKDSLREKSEELYGAVVEIASKVKALLQKNAEANELERMDPSEFVIDLEMKRDIEKRNEEMATKLRQKYHERNLENELVAARIRQSCWDTMATHSLALYPIQHENTDVVLTSYSIEKTSEKDAEMLARVKRLRAMEVRAQKMRGSGGAIEATPGGYYRCAWDANVRGCPSDVSWLVNDGYRWPCADVVEMLLQQSAAPTSPEGKSEKAQNASSNDSAKMADDDEEGGSLYAESTKEVERDFDENNVFNLLYPPQAARTQVQKRNQILLLKDILRTIKQKFNKHFDKLYHEKEDVVAAIEARNNRIREIATELETHVECMPLAWKDVEVHDSAITVADSEIESRPYETEAMREARLKEEERKRREAASDADDARRRALEDMMHGTLEVKRDVFAEASALQKPAWMDEIPMELMTEAQKKEVEEFQIKFQALQDEKVKYRKSLELEMKRLKQEVADASKMFDEKVVHMARLKVLADREVLSQELYISRLALNMVKREREWSALKSVEVEITETNKTARHVNSKMESLSNAVETAKARLQSAQDEERNMERHFKRDLQTLSNVTFDQDTLKIFSQLYRQRSYIGVKHGDDGDYSETGHHPDGRVSKGTATKRRQSLKGSFGSSNQAGQGSAMKSRMRGSKGSSVAGKDGGLGPMQQAAKEMKSTEQAIPLFSLKDPLYGQFMQQEKEKKIAESQIPLLVPLNIEIDCPEGFNVDQFVWSKLQELRTARIAKEIETKALLKDYNEIKRKLDDLASHEEALLSKAYALRSQREKILANIAELDSDLDIVVSMKQGQDEIDCDAVVTDYRSAKVIPTHVIDKYNGRINELGKEKIGVLTHIKQFRRKINLIDWEAKHLQLEAWHLEEYFTDVQLFRVTRDLQRVIGSNGEQAKVVMYNILWCACDMFCRRKLIMQHQRRSS